MVEKPSEPVTLSNRADDQSTESPTGCVANATHAVVDDSATKAQVVEEEIRDRIETAREALEQAQAVASEQAERYLGLLESYISLLLLWRGKASSMRAATSTSERRDDSSAEPWSPTREPGSPAIGHSETIGTCRLSRRNESKLEQ